MKLFPLLQAEKRLECYRDILLLTVKLFEKEVHGRSFLVVLSFFEVKVDFRLPLLPTRW